ncbi:acyl-CoA dehydrogenase [Wenzhouxiangella sp. XN79A]|uniref:acyl-CoA dehydrogenase C-terminal domain-containing protein n=1 Tax=Wenzhouxiangella sp. XN79A TaxID=2724193 RepID=UPI00144AD721|nr:acyl-CoA dehydrogenase C-terminal domain-containing protein [Wenzhouxiangella sp. XN79A]NKI34501.1 acyl-CoA dehydrogenase [Wenzhouxiangella sp. XN79A]
MPTYSAPLEDFRFLYHEYLDLEPCRSLPSMAEASSDLIDAVLDEAARLAQEVLQPINAVGDIEGCRYQDHCVTLPEGFGAAYKQYIENGWTGLTTDPDYGGQGLPSFLGLALSEMINAANPSFSAYPGLTHGAYEVLHAYGTDDQKRRFLPPMVEGRWSGTMNLTEPQCGTDLGLIRTRAEPTDDGRYRITGTKIWISAGEHDLCENIVHLVLARLPDAPAGTRGISLFVVPKFHVGEDGSLGERNGVRCMGLDHKMGMKASATCEMQYDGAIGELVGEQHRGLAAMFTMMNAARLVTGIQGLGMADVALQNAQRFALERLQGRSLDGARHPDKPADPIIVHPDVRRMLMIGRASVEGARALGLYTGVQLELEHHHADAEVRENAGHWVALMTPIIKACFTDIGSDVANLAMQVHGGAGYIVDTGVEQFVRDVRITQIYEGTNGVQALDLVGRKLVAHQGRTLAAFFQHAAGLLDSIGDEEGMSEFATPLAESLERLQATSKWLYGEMTRDPLEAGAASSDYLRLFALTALAFSWTGQAFAARRALAAGRGRPAFLEAKLATARFFFARMLPETLGLDAKVRAGGATLMALDAEQFRPD